MRITTYEKGGNSLNPFIKLSIFLMIVLCLFVIPVSAFEDNFNDDDITDWSVDSGSWTTENSSSINGVEDFYLYSGTIIKSAPAGTTTEEIHYTTDDSDHNYIEFNFRTDAVSTGNGWAQQTFKFSDNGSAYRALYIYSNVVTTSLRGSGFTYSNVALNKGVWYKAEISINEETNSVTIGIYDTTGNEIDEQTIAYTKIDNPTYITVMHSAHSSSVDAGRSNFYIDNIYTSDILPTTTTDISWTSSTYYLDDTGIYSYVIESDFWNFLYKYRVQILKNDIEIDTVKIGQIGTRYYDMNDVGTYQIKLQYSGYIFTNWISLDSDYTNVLEPADSYINVPLSDYTGNSFEISYLYGNTPILPFLKISKRLIDNTYVDINWIDLEDIGIVAGTTYTPTLTIYESGTYLIGIYDINLLSDDNSLLVASDTIRIFYKDAIEQMVISSSKIDTNNISIIGLGDILTGNYQVDSINYTNMSVRLEVYNYENDIISFSIPKQKQKGNYQIPITNQEFYTDQTGFVEATIYKVDSLFYTGNNQIRIAGYNQDGTFNQTLAFTNITIDYVNSAGYSLVLSKYTVLQNEEFTISIKCPTESTLNIWDDTGYNIKQFIISGNKDIKFSISETGKYYFGLNDPSGNLQGSQMLTVSESQIIEDDIIPDTTFQDNTTSLLNSPYLIGLFIMCVFLAIGATNGIGGTIVTGSIGLGIVCYMGIFPWILLVIEVLVVAALMAKGMINLAGD